MYDSRRLVMRTWSRFFIRTSGSIAARSDGWYISCIGSARRLQLGQARVDLGVVLVAVERGELLVDRGGRDLVAPTNEGLLSADPLLVASDLRRRVHHVDALERLLDLRLGLGHLRSADELIALLDELFALDAELVQSVLELVRELGLRCDLGLERLGLRLVADLPAERDPGQVIEAVGLGGVALGAQLVGSTRSGLRLVEPLARRGAGLTGVVLDHPKVADRLGGGLLGLGDVVREVADELVEHLLGVLGAVEDRVDVGSDELTDPSEDRTLCHRMSS